MPSDVAALAERVQTNAGYYQANYLAIVLLCLAYVCLARPVFAVVLALSAAGGYYVFAVQQGVLVVGGTVVSRQRMAAAWLALSLVLFLAAGRVTFLVMLLVSLVVVLLHATFRRRSLKARGSAFVGGTTPLGAAFKSLDDALHGSDDDDDEETVAGAGSGDAENPYARRQQAQQQQQQQQFYPQQQHQPQQQQSAYPAYPGAAGGGAAPYQNDAFRAQMRRKYQRPA